MNRVAGKVALVTGAASGLGEAIARKLAEEGATVVLADLGEAAGEGVVAGIRAAGGTAEYRRLDVTQEADWQREMAALVERHGRLDIAVNCAGISTHRSFPSETTLVDWRRVMAVNLDGVFLGTKHAVAAMQAGSPPRGSIVNISSVMGLVALPGIAPYVASKGGVRLYSKSVALSCAEKGLAIRVNSVHPGFIDTPLLRRAIEEQGGSEELRRRYDALAPVGHLGQPEDIAWGVVYLASDESKFVTGAELVIDGGFTAR